MNYQEYTVRVFNDGIKRWYQNGNLHRDDGPAIEYADGGKAWYLEGIRYTEEEYKKKLQPSPCEGKVVEIEGKKYKLVLV